MGCIKLTYSESLRILKVVSNNLKISVKSYAGDYRYGFQRQEMDDEVAGEGNSYTAEFWQYDSRLGRRWNIDPIVKTHESPYAAFANNPIWFSDPNGADTIVDIVSKNIGDKDIDVNNVNAMVTERTPGQLIFNVYQDGNLTTYYGWKSESNPDGLDKTSQYGMLVNQENEYYTSGGSIKVLTNWYKVGGLYKKEVDRYKGSNHNFKYSSTRDMGSLIGATSGIFTEMEISFKLDKTKVNKGDLENYGSNIQKLNNLAKYVNNHSTRENAVKIYSPISGRQNSYFFGSVVLKFHGYHSPEHSNFSAAKGNYQLGAPSIGLGLFGNEALDIDRSFNSMNYVLGRVKSENVRGLYFSGGESDKRKVVIQF